MRRASPGAIIGSIVPLRGGVRARVAFGPYPVGRDRPHAERSDMGRLGLFVLARLPASDPRSRRRRAVRRCAPVLGGGAGGVPCFAERELRAPGTGGLLRRPRRGGGPRVGRGGLPGRKLCPPVDLVFGRLGHARRVRAPRHRDPASGGCYRAGTAWPSSARRSPLSCP